MYLYDIKYFMDEICFLCFYTYLYLLLLIDVATVSRWGAPVLVASNLIKSSQ